MKQGTRRAKVKKGDLVIVMTGKDYNIYNADGVRTPLRGKVLDVDPVKKKVKVEGARIVTKHKKANRATNEEGGIVREVGWTSPMSS